MTLGIFCRGSHTKLNNFANMMWIRLRHRKSFFVKCLPTEKSSQLRCEITLDLVWDQDNPLVGIVDPKVGHEDQRYHTDDLTTRVWEQTIRRVLLSSTQV